MGRHGACYPAPVLAGLQNWTGEEDRQAAQQLLQQDKSEEGKKEKKNDTYMLKNKPADGSRPERHSGHLSVQS